jgi:sulfur carrier protein
MNLMVNGHERECAEGTTVSDLLQAMHIGADVRGVAVARNGEVIVRSRWQDEHLTAGDHVEVLHAVQGG